MDFRLIWEASDGARRPVTLQQYGRDNGSGVFCAKAEELEWNVLDRGDGEYEIRILNPGAKDVTGRALVEFDWIGPEKGFTLIPGVYYNGNYHEYLNTATYLKMPGRPLFRISLAAAATPCMMVWDGESEGTHLELSPFSYAGWNGAELDGSRRTFTFSIPAGTDDCNGTRTIERSPYTWHRRDVVGARFRLRKFACACPSELYGWLFENGRSVYKHPAHNEMRSPAEGTVRLVRQWLMKRHWLVTENGKPILKNATTEYDAPVAPEACQEWNDMMGWCSGPMTALPLLSAEGETRRRALIYMDFVVSDGFSPCGLKLPVFDGKEWIDPRPEYCPAENNQYEHCRFFCDYLYYLGRAIRYENSRGECHPAWEKEFKKEILIVLDLWEREHDFGLYWDVMGDALRLKYPGTGAGAYALQALTEALRLGIEPERIRAALKEADDVYYERCVKSGRCYGGPNDIREADDSESIAALTDAYVMQYELTGEKKLLTYACEAGHIFASWCLSWCPPFPGGSALEGLNVCGGVIANVQNRHVGPGICTNSGRFLKRLGELTGNEKWEQLYQQVRCTAYNCVCRSDGEFESENFREHFRCGMVTEQINVYDVYSKPGFAWCVSASWPATNILLNDFDERCPEGTVTDI